MRFFNYYRYRDRNKSACTAKARLQCIVAQERMQRSGFEYLPLLQHDLLQVIRRFVDVDQDNVTIDIARHNGCESLEITIALPHDKHLQASLPHISDAPQTTPEAAGGRAASVVAGESDSVPPSSAVHREPEEDGALADHLEPQEPREESAEEHQEEPEKEDAVISSGSALS